MPRGEQVPHNLKSCGVQCFNSIDLLYWIFSRLSFQLELWGCCGNIPRSKGCRENSSRSICEVNKSQFGILCRHLFWWMVISTTSFPGFLVSHNPCKLAHLHKKRRWKLLYGVIFWTMCIVVVGADACLWYHQTLFHHFVISRNHSAFCHYLARNTIILRISLAIGRTSKHMTKVKVSLEILCLGNLSISGQCKNICAQFLTD